MRDKVHQPIRTANTAHITRTVDRVKTCPDNLRRVTDVVQQRCTKQQLSVVHRKQRCHHTHTLAHPLHVRPPTRQHTRKLRTRQLKRPSHELVHPPTVVTQPLLADLRR